MRPRLVSHLARWASIAVMALAAQAPAQTPAPQASMAELVRALAAASVGTNAGAIVGFRELKALLPAELPGLKRTIATGGSTSGMGPAVSLAVAAYAGDDGSGIEVRISDLSGMGGPAAAARVRWAALEIDRANDAGFERTTTYSGHKAVEQYDTGARKGSVQVLVGNRFLVEADGHGVDMPAIRDAARAVDLAKLLGFKNREPPKTDTPASATAVPSERNAPSTNAPLAPTAVPGKEASGSP